MITMSLLLNCSLLTMETRKLNPSKKYLSSKKNISNLSSKPFSVLLPELNQLLDQFGPQNHQNYSPNYLIAPCGK